jgi:O-methyltransferase involved in polyketide biosynthesis
MIDEKERLLSGEKPRCRLRRERIDLVDPVARATFLEHATAGAKKTLVLTEGLLVYLDQDVVRAIGRDLLAHPAIRWWVFDVIAPAILHMLQKGMGVHLDNAPLKLAPADGVAFFEKLGWKALDIRSYFREAIRLRRGPLLFRLFAFFPEPDARKPGNARWSAAVRFERGGHKPSASDLP